MQVINLTPHAITVFDSNGKDVLASYPPSGNVLRLGTKQMPFGDLNGVPVVRQRLIELEGWPSDEMNEDTAYIVSLLTLPVVADMEDGCLYIAPDTGPYSVVRDDKGNILGVRQFVTVG